MKFGGEKMTGRNIKNYLISKGISQTYVANKTGIPISTLNAILNGNRKLLAEEYFVICQALDVPLETFIDIDQPA
jgi:transcriptional regulator with XRE-family HTH domain